jgi:hypothetical protein
MDQTIPLKKYSKVIVLSDIFREYVLKYATPKAAILPATISSASMAKPTVSIART